MKKGIYKYILFLLISFFMFNYDIFAETLTFSTEDTSCTIDIKSYTQTEYLSTSINNQLFKIPEENSYYFSATLKSAKLVCEIMCDKSSNIYCEEMGSRDYLRYACSKLNSYLSVADKNIVCSAFNQGGYKQEYEVGNDEKKSNIYECSGK